MATKEHYFPLPNKVGAILRDAGDDSVIGQYAYDGLYRRTTRTLNDGTVYHSYYTTDWRSVEERKGASTTPDNAIRVRSIIKKND